MSTRSIKLLAATTALVAAASGANAAANTISGTTTTGITDASATTIVYVSGSSLVSVTGLPAVVVSGTDTYTLGISASSTLKSNATSGTINMGAVASTTAITGGITISNSGAIINTDATGYAISLTDTMISTLQPSVTIANAGTISGSIATGDQVDTITNYSGGAINGAINAGAGANIISNSGTITGAVTTGADADTLTNRGTITGAVNVGAGSNVIDNLNGTITGNVTAGTNGDKLTNQGGTITGNVNLGDGANIVRLASASTLTGDLTLGSGNDTLYISNSSVITGDVTLGTGTNTVHVSDTNFTQRGGWNFAGTDTLNVSGTYNISGTVTGTVETIQLAQGATLNTSQSFTATTANADSATVRVAAGKTLTATTLGTNNDTVLKFDIASSTAAGAIALTNGFGADVVSVTAVFANNTGFIASGTTFLLVDSAATTSATLTDTNVGVYRLSLRHNIDSGNDISLLVGRVSTSSLADNGSNAAIANALDTNYASTNTGMVNLQNLISKQTTTAGVNTVLEQLNPATDTGAAMASVDVGNAAGNNISGRLAALRGTSLNAGDMMSSGHMWVQGFGSTAEQKDKGGFKGYDSNSAGATFGADSDTVLDGHTVGLAFTYANSGVDSKNSNNAETDVDSYMGTVYGSRVFDEGYFVNAQGSLGYNKYDMKRTVTGLGQADADTNGWQVGLKGEVGRDMEVDTMTITPAFGLAYNHLSMDDYTETGIGGAGLTVNPDSVNTLDASLGATVAWNLPMEGGSTLKPALRAKYGYRMGDDTLESTTNFIGAPGTAFTTSGVKADRSSLGLGAGLNWLTDTGVDLSVNYDADLRSKYTGHTGQVKARWAF